MTKKLFLFALTLMLNLKCLALELSHEDKKFLEVFFRTMIKDSEAGYVLYGKKPICIHGFRIEDYFIGANEMHRQNVDLREGARTWQKLNWPKPNSNIIIHIYDGADSLVKDCIHVLFINKDLFIKTVQSNLPLFQYVLGPEITPQKLLKKLIDPKERWHAVLKEDKVLIGILLGFGTQNSLYVSRIENLEKSFFSAEYPPFKNHSLNFGSIQNEFKRFLLFRDGNYFNQVTNIEPSFSYQSLEEEIKDLRQKIDISSLKLVKQSPMFIFGRLKNDQETDVLVSELESIQDEINKLLSSRQFLEKVIKYIYPKEAVTISKDSSIQSAFDRISTDQLSFLVAANIWKVIEDENREYQQAFIKGMKIADEALESLSISEDTLKYQKLKVLLQAKENLEIANDYFLQLHQDKTITQLIPFQLYYKVVKEGTGRVLDNYLEVLVHYTIKTPSDEVLTDTWTKGQPNRLNLSNAISGFAWGIRGMKIGEIREIFIHPSLAYGVYTTLDKNIYLKVYVQLVDILEEQKSSQFPALIELDLMADISSTLDQEYEEQAKKVGYTIGYKVWQHYKKGNFYQLSQVLKYIHQFQFGEINSNISSDNNQEILNQLHWNLYQKS